MGIVKGKDISMAVGKLFLSDIQSDGYKRKKGGMA